MASKSKEVRIVQRRVLEKKLELRLSKLAGHGISKEKAKSDPIVKSLKSKIRETNIRIAAFDKNIQKTQELAKAKEQKLAAKTVPKEAEAAPEKGSKPKKKAPPSEKETKKQAAAPEGDAPKKPRKKKEETPAE